MKRKTALTAIAITASAFGLAALGGAGLATAGTAQQTRVTENEAARHAKVMAIKFHADWCGSCKAMGPVFEEMQAKFDREPALFIELDHTREFDRRQSAYLAHALGLDRVWKDNGGKTGFILLVDATTKSVLQRLTADQDLKQMGAALQDAVASASEPKAGEHPTGEHPKKSEHPEHPGRP